MAGTGTTTFQWRRAEELGQGRLKLGPGAPISKKWGGRRSRQVRQPYDGVNSIPPVRDYEFGCRIRSCTWGPIRTCTMYVHAVHIPRYNLGPETPGESITCSGSGYWMGFLPSWIMLSRESCLTPDIDRPPSSLTQPSPHPVLGPDGWNFGPYLKRYSRYKTLCWAETKTYFALFKEKKQLKKMFQALWNRTHLARSAFAPIFFWKKGRESNARAWQLGIPLCIHQKIVWDHFLPYILLRYAYSLKILKDAQWKFYICDWIVCNTGHKPQNWQKTLGVI